MSTPTPDNRDEQDLARLLRAALRSEAERVTVPADGLSRIRQRTARQAGSSRPRWAALAAAAALVVVAGVGIGAGLLRRGGTSGVVPAATPSTSVSSSSAPVSTAPVLTVAVPVYWLGPQGSTTRLYREFEAVPATRVSDPAGKAQAAADLALGGTPADPRYFTPWARGSAATVSLTGTGITVDLNATAAGTQMSRQTADLALAQLVWTVTAAAGENVPVSFTVGGSSNRLLSGVSLAQPFTRADPSYTVLAAIWVVSPQQGVTVTSPVTVTGQATVFEGTVQWQLSRDGAVIRSGYTTATAGGPARGDWTVQLGDLPPGSYTFRAYADSPAGNGTLQGEDTKGFTVG